MTGAEQLHGATFKKAVVRDVLSTVHANYKHIPFNKSVLLQFHRDLMKYAGRGWTLEISFQ